LNARGRDADGAFRGQMNLRDINDLIQELNLTNAKYVIKDFRGPIIYQNILKFIENDKHSNSPQENMPVMKRAED
jgi:hypothetical protein